MANTNWTVLTAGPSAGKTCTVNALALEGHRIKPEVSRFVMDQAISDGYDLDELIGTDSFQDAILQTQYNAEIKTDDDEHVYFDRSVVDVIAYNRYFDVHVTDYAREYVKNQYDTVYVLEQLPFESDYARHEDEDEARELHQLLIDTYEEFGYDVEMVPVKPIIDRVRQIAGNRDLTSNFLHTYSE